MVIVFDIGTDRCKIGFAGDNDPAHIFSSVTGTCYNPQTQQKSTFVGNTNEQILSITYPVERGIVTNWNSMDTIFQHAWSHLLRVDPKDFPILFSEPILSPKSNREQLAQLCFENYLFPSLFVEYQPILGFYYCGRTSGMIIESGDGVTCTLPFYEGNILHEASLRQDFAGRDVTHYLMQLVNQTQSKYSFHSFAEREIAKQIKHSVCSIQPNKQTTCQEKIIYSLPNGEEIQIGEERFQSCEALFQPQLVDAQSNLLGLHQLLYQSYQLCDIDIRKDMRCNFLLTGGNTRLPGMKHRLMNELDALLPLNHKKRIVEVDGGGYETWIGASILASLSTFLSVLITKEEYHEYGAQIMHTKAMGR